MTDSRLDIKSSARLLVERLRQRLDSHFKLTILDALFMCASSWRDVKTETVMKCFQHAGFEVDNTTCTRPTPSHEYEPDRDEETRNLFDQFSTIVTADQLDVDLDPPQKLLLLLMRILS